MINRKTELKKSDEMSPEADREVHMKNLAKKILRKMMNKEQGIDGILVTVGLCIIALLLCVVMKDSLASFIETIVTALQNKATTILTGV